MKAPDKCVYCDGTDPNCGFCEMGVPLDTQEDWDASWGRVLDVSKIVAGGAGDPASQEGETPPATPTYGTTE